MKRTVMEELQAMRRAEQMPFCRITTQDAITVGRTPAAVPWQQVTEAVFFNEKEQLTLKRSGAAWQAVLLEDEPQDEFLPEEQRGLLPAFGGVLTVRQAVEYDDDGQARRGVLRLVSWKEG